MHLICDFQNHFVVNKSCLTDLTFKLSKISEGIYAYSKVDVICTDFQKTFDQIDHYLLLLKLS